MKEEEANSEASANAADNKGTEAALKLLKEKEAKLKQAAVLLPTVLGGHQLEHTLVGKALRWKRSKCLEWSASWSRIAPLKCAGKASNRWKISVPALLPASVPVLSTVAVNQMQAVAMTGEAEVANRDTPLCGLAN